MTTNIHTHETMGLSLAMSPLGKILACLTAGLAMAPLAHAANWGSISAGVCKSSNMRTYSAILWDIPWGQSWEDACANQSATINGQYFSRPTRCVNTGTNMWGEWDVVDSTCPHWSSVSWGCYGEGVDMAWAVLRDVPLDQSGYEACAAEPIPTSVSHAFYGVCWPDGDVTYGLWYFEDPMCCADGTWGDC